MKRLIATATAIGIGVVSVSIGYALMLANIVTDNDEWPEDDWDDE